MCCNVLPSTYCKLDCCRFLLTTLPLTIVIQLSHHITSHAISPEGDISKDFALCVLRYYNINTNNIGLELLPKAIVLFASQ